MFTYDELAWSREFLQGLYVFVFLEVLELSSCHASQDMVTQVPRELDEEAPWNVGELSS